MLNRKELYKRVAEKTNTPIAETEMFVDVTLNEIAESIIRREKVHFNGLFSIKSVLRKPKEGTDFKNANRIIIPSYYKPHVTFSDRIKQLLNKKV